jgi:FkbM family methyltransferase
VFENAIIRLSQLVPQSLRSGLASSSYGNLARRILSRLKKDPFPVAQLCGPLAGQRMRVNWALHKTYVFGTHEPMIMRTMQEVVQPGWTVVDIGAHIGYSTLLLAKCVGPKGKVIAFEPLTQNFKMLEENIRLNQHTNVFAENLALMERPGQIELRSATPGALTWVASTATDAAAAVESQRVNAVTFDGYAGRNGIARVDFVKMDVEGAETDVLSGMTGILERDRPVLLIEIHQYARYGDNHPALLKLRGLHYDVSPLGFRNWELHVLAKAGDLRESKVGAAAFS